MGVPGGACEKARAAATARAAPITPVPEPEPPSVEEVDQRSAAPGLVAVSLPTDTAVGDCAPRSGPETERRRDGGSCTCCIGCPGTAGACAGPCAGDRGLPILCSSSEGTDGWKPCASGLWTTAGDSAARRGSYIRAWATNAGSISWHPRLASTTRNWGCMSPARMRICVTSKGDSSRFLGANCGTHGGRGLDGMGLDEGPGGN